VSRLHVRHFVAVHTTLLRLINLFVQPSREQQAQTHRSKQMHGDSKAFMFIHAHGEHLLARQTLQRTFCCMSPSKSATKSGDRKFCLLVSSMLESSACWSDNTHQLQYSGATTSWSDRRSADQFIAKPVPSRREVSARPACSSASAELHARQGNQRLHMNTEILKAQQGLRYHCCDSSCHCCEFANNRSTLGTDGETKALQQMCSAMDSHG